MVKYSAVDSLMPETLTPFIVQQKISTKRNFY